MRAVSDTSPIANLAALGRLELLKSQFPEVWVPGSVLKELSNYPDHAAREAFQDALGEEWIRCVSPSPSPLLNLLLQQLSIGEAEAIALATELNIGMVILDEQEARDLAVQTGMHVIGVLGILLRAKREGEISALRPEIQSLRNKGKFLISPHVEAKILAAAGE